MLMLEDEFMVAVNVGLNLWCYILPLGYLLLLLKQRKQQTLSKTTNATSIITIKGTMISNLTRISCLVNFWCNNGSEQLLCLHVEFKLPINK